MKRTLNILMTTLLILTGCQDKPSLDPVPGPSETYPIQFGISADLDVESKAVIDNSNVTGFSFFALGNLTVDGEQQTNLFGENGAIVSYGTDSWTYSPLRYWQPGSYEFAAVMPFIAGYTPSFSASNQLTLNFANGFNLASSQTDLMVAFNSRTVQSVSAALVNFNFDHQFALVTMEGASKDPSTEGIKVTGIKVFGNSAKTSGNMTFTDNQETVSATYTLTGATNSSSPYKTFLAADEAGTQTTDDWTLVAHAADGTPVYDVLIPELIVFPETCTFTIVVNYTDENDNPKTMTGTLPATWEAGKKYTYRFHLASDISFSVEVAKWGTPIMVGENEIPII